MQNVLSRITLIAVLMVLAAGTGYAKDNKLALETSITCGGCVSKIKTAFNGVDGINGVEADVASKMVTVSFDDEKINSDKIQKTVKDLGYDAKKASCDASSKECDSKKDKAHAKAKDCGSKKDCCKDKKAKRASAEEEK